MLPFIVILGLKIEEHPIKMYFEIDLLFNGKHADRYYVFVGLTPTRGDKDVRKLRKKINLNPVGSFNNLFI